MDFYTIIFINNVVIAERIYRFILCIDDSIFIITFNYEQIGIAGRVNVLVIKWDTYFVFAVNDTFLLVLLYNEEITFIGTVYRSVFEREKNQFSICIKYCF